MSHEIVIGPCFCCGRPFLFDPGRVPVILVDPASHLPSDLGGDPTAEPDRCPICPDCAKAANPKRIAAGRAPMYDGDTAQDAARGGLT